MNDFPHSLTAAVRATASHARQNLGEHPAPAELAAYHEGGLSDEASWRLRRHLALCPECTETVLDLERFPEVESRDPSATLSASALEEDWQDLERRLAALRMVPPPRAATPAWYTALAAALAAAVIGLAFWNVRLHRQLAATGAPAANIQVTELVPGDAITRSGDPTDVVELPPASDSVVFLLALSTPQSYEDLRAVVFDSADRKLAEQQGLRRLPGGSFSLELQRDHLPTGAMRIDLYDTAGTLVASYPFVVERLAEP